MKATEWKRVSLSEICKFKYGQMPKKTDLSGEGYPVFSGYGIVGYATSYHYELPEVIIVARGVGGTGDVKFSPPKCFLTNLSIAAQVASPVVDKQFLFYRLNYPSLWELRTGSAQAQITIERLNRHEVDIPPLPTQRKIAGILSAYDDLIENNTRRIAILEQMAQAIYREWFVEFRFPGHENVKLVDSELGKIPEGWEVTSLKKITNKIGSGSTPRGGKGAYKQSGITLIRSLNVYDNHFELGGLAFINDEQADHLNNVVVEKRDILLNITGASVARCCIVPSHLLPARVNQHVAIIRVDPNICDPFYVLNTINSERHKRQILSLAQGGATREALTKDTISNYEILLPPISILTQYSEVITDIFDQREILQKEINCLRKTRDLLLPRLISGELNVEESDTESHKPISSSHYS